MTHDEDVPAGLAPPLLRSRCPLVPARTAQPTTPNKVVEMEALRIVAKHDEEGNYSFESYDAEELFQRANAELDAGRCKEAVPLYDRITSEFAASHYTSAAYYNAGLCLAQLGDKAGRARALRGADQAPARLAGRQARHASRPGTCVPTLQPLGARRLDRCSDACSPAPISTAPSASRRMSLRAQALLGRDDLERRSASASQALTYYRTRTPKIWPPTPTTPRPQTSWWPRPSACAPRAWRFRTPIRTSSGPCW